MEWPVSHFVLFKASSFIQDHFLDFILPGDHTDSRERKGHVWI